jgi:Raf kinase inhibitor-like YbhB/YbcL family protein/uncharacterized protein (TIGR00297 family)
MQIVIGFVFALIVAIIAFFLRSLTFGGAVSAAILGTIVFGLGGLPWAILLLGFFISSSLLSHFLKKRKALFEEKFSKSSRRDSWQVAANGLISGICVLANLLLPDKTWPWLAFSGALAAVNADTWATELGILARGKPRLITSGKIVDKGTSGGISIPGTLASLAGAALIGLLAGFFWPGETAGTFLTPAMIAVLVVSLAGLAGSLVDSVIGASWQAIYYCPTCQKETERHPHHTCGTQTTLIRGFHWLNNDWVNGICSLTGALVAVIAGFALISPVTLSTGEKLMTDISISSPSFQNGAAIPDKFSCDGENLSPVIQWSGLPANTASLALIADDPDAPFGTFNHWVIYNLASDQTGLPEGIAKTNEIAGLGTQGLNSFGKTGYDGPCPPRGSSHRYFFKLYALDLPPNLPVGMDSAGLQKSIRNHILAQGQIVGIFKR